MSDIPERRRREDVIQQEAHRKVAMVRRYWAVAFAVMFLVVAGLLYAADQRDIGRLERLATLQCERVQRLREEVNDVIRANRRIAVAGESQVQPGSDLAREFRLLLVNLQEQDPVDCRLVAQRLAAAAR
ncbi:MAG TPA: hypothetical protein VNT51_00940 [Miltoncostaeaceae bacterium]|nr:hypothetical protein [Miltoncostaeaceae bacterium]